MFEMTYLMIAAMAAVLVIGGGGLQAGWMPLSTASCLNKEAYGCMRTSAHFMNI